jgi:hypothetical protein
MKRFLILSAVLLFASPVFSQTLSPIVQQNGKKLNGSFTVHNDSLAPVFVVIERFTSTYDSHGRHFSELNPLVHVSLSESSFRLGPQQTEEISYHGKVDGIEPQSFVFLVEMTLGHTATAGDSHTIQVRIELPETVYACPTGKADRCRERMLTEAGLLARK